MLKEYLNQREFKLSVIFLLMQQLIVSFSSVLLYQAVFNWKINPFNPYLWLYFISLILPYVFGGMGNYYSAIAEFEYFREKLRNNLELFSKKILIWSEHNSKDKFNILISKELQIIIEKMSFYCNDFLSIFFNIFFNIFILGFYFEFKFTILFILCLIFAWYIYKKTLSLLEEVSILEQNSRLALNTHLLSSWDNIVLNNKSTYRRYVNEYHNRIIQYKNSLYQAKYTHQITGIGLTFLFFIPIILYLMYFIYSSSQEESLALLALLPRVFFTLTFVGSLLSLLAQYPEIRVITLNWEKELEKISNIIIAEKTIENRIQMNKITVNGKHINLEEFILELKNSLKGRYCIRGENGAGKSTLLLLIKSRLEEEGFYLPTKHQLYWENNKTHYSSGENSIYWLENISNTTEKYILIDEWDAHLDKNNIELFNQKIQLIAHDKVVVEIRH